MARAYTLTVRRGGVTEKHRFADLPSALDALETELRALSQTERSGAVNAVIRDYEPVQLVAVRGELSGRGVRGGVDIRGDGSAEAFTGRFRRSLLVPGSGESPYDALRQALMPSAAPPDPPG